MLLILIILFTTIFFCHGLIRLCMLIVRPRGSAAGQTSGTDQMRQRGGIMHDAALVVPGGYAIPREPIRVVLARDEEAAGIESETTKTKPPAYGLWRESVVCFLHLPWLSSAGNALAVETNTHCSLQRVDPNRIYWQRTSEVMPAAASDLGGSSSTSTVDGSTTVAGESSSSASSGPGGRRQRRGSSDGDDASSVYSSSGAGGNSGPRPPSYVSDDGITYVVNAAPRSTILFSAEQAAAVQQPLPQHPAERGDWSGRPAAW